MIHKLFACLLTGGIAAGCGGGAADPSSTKAGPLSAGKSVDAGVVHRAESRAEAGAAEPAPFDADALMDWAEQQYPQFFPGHPESQTQAPYRYRYYAAAGNYLGVAGRNISVLGPLSGGAIAEVGTLGQFECLARPQACAQAESPRIVIGTSIAAGRRTDGSWVAWGDESARPADQQLLSLKGAMELGSGLKQVVLNDDLGIVVDSSGTAHGWGKWGWAVGASLALPVKYADRVKMAFPGPVRQAGAVLDASSWRSYALLEDGTMWAFPGTGSDVLNRRPMRVVAPDNLHSISAAVNVALGVRSVVHGLARDGTVWRISLVNREPPKQLPGLDQVASIDCLAVLANLCVAVRRDGSVLAWAVADAGHAVPNSALKPDEPLKVPGIPAMKSAEAASRIQMLSTDGTLWTWAFDYSFIIDAQGNRTAYLKDPERSTTSGGTDLSCASSSCILRRSNGSLVQVPNISATLNTGLPALP